MSPGPVRHAMLGRLTHAGLVIALVLGAALPALTAASDPLLEDEDRLGSVGELEPYRGDLHAHTAYSDGEDTPEAAFQQAHASGWLDFFAVTEHSEWLVFPFRADTDCLSPGALACYETPLPHRTEWDEIGHQAQRFTDEGFLAIRGFEWSSPVEGHVNVYETTLWTDTVQTAPAPMTGLYGWLEAQALDEDRFATFNHPGREPLTFDGFTYVPSADPLFVSLEAFNRDDDYSDTYLDALDQGWHVGAHGVTDGHSQPARLDRGAGHTVALMDAPTKDALRRALVQHHTVATRGSDQDARFFVDGQLMGDTVTDPGDAVTVEATLFDAGTHGPTAFETVELLGPDGYQRELAIGPDGACQAHPIVEHRLDCQATVDVDALPTTALDERYLTLRAYQTIGEDPAPTVMTSAVWILG